MDKLLYNIIVEYKLDDVKDGLNFDDRLEEIAKKFKGYSTGSGFLFEGGIRDINFEFKTPEKATSFLKRARRFKCVINTQFRIYNKEGDEI